MVMRSSENPPRQVHAKVTEYLERIKAGEDELSIVNDAGPFKAQLMEELSKMRESETIKTTMPSKENLKESTFTPTFLESQDVDSLKAAIQTFMPEKYHDYIDTPEVLEELWQKTYTIDAEKDTQEHSNREYALTLIKTLEAKVAYEAQKEKEREVQKEIKKQDEQKIESLKNEIVQTIEHPSFEYEEYKGTNSELERGIDIHNQFVDITKGIREGFQENRESRIQKLATEIEEGKKSVSFLIGGEPQFIQDAVMKEVDRRRTESKQHNLEKKSFTELSPSEIKTFLESLETVPLGPGNPFRKINPALLESATYNSLTPGEKIYYDDGKGPHTGKVFSKGAASTLVIEQSNGVTLPVQVAFMFNGLYKLKDIEKVYNSHAN